MPDLTTLQLARLIADAVVEAYEDCPSFTDGTRADVTIRAVLHVLHDTDSWFCRLKETPKGTVETAYEQVELFP